MKRKLHFLIIVALTAFMGTLTVSAQTPTIPIELPGTFEAESGALTTSTVGVGNGGSIITGFYGSSRYVEYNVNVATAGFYDLSVVYLNTNSSSYSAGLKVSIPSMPFNVFGGIFLPKAGTATSGGYAVANKVGFYLPSGNYVLKIENATGYGVSIDKFTISSNTTARNSFGTIPSITILGANDFEAENYDVGGQGITYFDSTLSNSGPIVTTSTHYRQDNVDVASNPTNVGSPSNANVVTNIADAEWIDYTVNVVDAGNYKLSATFAAASDTGLTLTADRYNTAGELQSALITTPLVIGTSGSATTYDSTGLSEMFSLTAGNHVIRVKFAGGTGSAVFLDKLKLTYDSNLGVNDFIDAKNISIAPNPSSDGVFNLAEATKWEVYSVLGVKVAAGEGTSINISSAAKGNYIVKTGNSSKVVIYN